MDRTESKSPLEIYEAAAAELKGLLEEDRAYRKQLEAESDRLRTALHWIAGYGKNEGDFLDRDGWAEAMRSIALNALAVQR